MTTQNLDSHEFLVRTNRDVDQWMDSFYAEGRKANFRMHCQWAWQEQERRKEAVINGEKAKPVLWQVRFCYGENTSTPGWGQWETVMVRNSYAGETVESRVKEIQSYIDRGYLYQLRALYEKATGEQS